jgi:predicted XRE-type DNA-binding protein
VLFFVPIIFYTLMCMDMHIAWRMQQYTNTVYIAHALHQTGRVPGAVYCFQKKSKKQPSRYRLGLETLSRPVAGAKQMNSQRFANIWDAIEDTPEEAENMKLRSILMTALKQHITHVKMSQAEAAKLLGVTQPRVSDLMHGKINVFGLDALVNMAAAAGLHIEIARA